MENNDKTAHRKVIHLCYNDAENDNLLQSRNILAKKWKGRGIKLPPKNKYDESRYKKRGSGNHRKGFEYGKVRKYSR